MTELRKVDILRAGMWYNSDFEDIKKGDLFRMFEPDNTIVFGNRAEFKTCEILVSYLTDRNDPRLSAYIGLNADGVYRGKPAGLLNLPSEEWGYENVSPIGDFYLQPETPGVFMSYAQLELLKSEAATKGYITSDAATHYNNGVTASIMYSGGTAAEAAAYVANVAYS